MMKAHKKLRDVVEILDEGELHKILKDLETGGIHLYNLIKAESKKRYALHHAYCSNCSVEIDSESPSSYTIIFGPADFKKKVTFCGKDCMEYFMKNLNVLKKDNQPKVALSSTNDLEEI